MDVLLSDSKNPKFSITRWLMSTFLISSGERDCHKQLLVAHFKCPVTGALFLGNEADLNTLYFLSSHLSPFPRTSAPIP